MPKRGSETLFVEVGADRIAAPSRERFRAAAARARLAMRAKRRQGATVHSSGRVFNDWLSRARADIALLTTELPTGPYPYAGIPWFSTAFGRDGVISALQMLWLDPALARGVLAFLAQHQATETSPFSDSQPGKIMHETRKGEMAVLRELPFGRYYGGVDTTPLYIYLAGAYADRTGDMAFIDTLWPSLVAAAAWMEDASRHDGNGFVTYQRAAEFGPRQPGLEGQLRFRLPRRRPHSERADRAGRGAGLCLRRLSRPGRARRRDGEDADGAAHWTDCAEKMRAAVERSFLDGGARLLCAGARRRRRSLARCAHPMPVICSMSACRRRSARNA